MTASLLSSWVARFDPPKNTVRNLTGADVSNFWAAVGELQVAAALVGLGFDVDLRRAFDRAGAAPLTPDLFASKDGLAMIVEVARKKNDRVTEEAERLLDDIASELESRLDLPSNGFLSLSVLPTPTTRLDAHPGREVMDQLVNDLNGWLRSAPDAGYRRLTGPLPVQGTLMRGDRPQVAVTPPGGPLGQTVRIRSTIAEKAERYSVLASPETPLTVALVAGGWKVTEGQAVDALLGGERIVVDGTTHPMVHVAYDGRGAGVRGGPFDRGAAESLSGVWHVEQVGQFEGHPPGLRMRLAFIHNPYARFPIDPARITAPRQLVRQGSGMGWLPGDPTLLLR